MPEQWLTYRALAQRLELSLDATRRWVRKSALQRRVGQSGQTEILVDTSTLPPHGSKNRLHAIESARPSHATKQSTKKSRSRQIRNQEDYSSEKALQALEEHVGTLKSQLQRMEELVDERSRETAALQVHSAGLSNKVSRLSRQLDEAHEVIDRLEELLLGVGSALFVLPPPVNTEESSATASMPTFTLAA